MDWTGSDKKNKRGYENESACEPQLKNCILIVRKEEADFVHDSPSLQRVARRDQARRTCRTSHGMDFVVIVFVSYLSLLAAVAGGPSHRAASNRSKDGVSSTVSAAVDALVARRVDQAEQRLARRLADQLRPLNQSVVIGHLEKLLYYVNEEMQVNRDTTAQHGEELARHRKLLEQQQREARASRETVAGLQATVGNLTAAVERLYEAAATAEKKVDGEQAESSVSSSQTTESSYPEGQS